MHNIFEIIIYKTENNNVPLEKYLARLIKKDKKLGISQINMYIERLKECGLTVNDKYSETIKKIRGDIWELRPGSHRILFFCFKEKFVLLHAFEKKTNTTPNNEIKNAKAEMMDYIRRNKDG